MDAFYASVEQRDNADYRGKPLVVGYSGQRGVVAAASYEARKFGIHSAMPSLTAKRLCPELIFAQPRFDVYKAISAQIMEIFKEYTDKVEPLSLDEAFLDVSENKKNMLSATLIAKEIKQKIYEKTQLTASAGVSYNKFLAKIASDINKPDGIFVITPEKSDAFISKLPISKFYGIGKVTEKKMYKIGVFTGADLKEISEAKLVKLFGKTGSMYYKFCRGIDIREVEANYVRKSLGVEETFLEDISEPVELLRALHDIVEELNRKVSKKVFNAKTLILKIKFEDFTSVTRSKTVSYYINSEQLMFDLAKDLLLKEQKIQKKKIRLLGVSLKKSENQKTVEEDTNLKTTQLTFEFMEWEY